MFKAPALKAFALIGSIIILLAACAPAGGLNNADQVASIVASTLTAESATLPTQAPLDGEIPTQSSFGACPNSGQLSLVYIKDNNVWLWVQNGPHTQLTVSGDANDVRISSDGCRIAYNRSFANPLYDPNVGFAMPENLQELWVMASDGSGAHVLADANFFAAQPPPFENTIFSLYDFEWQPGSYTLAFNTDILHEGVGQSLGNDLYTVSADGGAPTMLLGYAQAGGRFAFSPDGQQIAFSSATAVGVINADGSNFRSNLITYPLVLTYSEYAFSPIFRWGPDSQSLMVAVPPEDGLAQPANGVYPETDLWYIPLDGTLAFQAGAVQNVPLAFNDLQFSPDAGRIAYPRPLDPSGEPRELVIALSNGSNELPTIQVPAIRFEAWSLDNSQYIYSYYDPNMHLFLGNVSNANVSPISTLDAFPAVAAEVQWVEGSTFILLLHSNSDSSQISVMDTSGAGVIVATNANFNLAFDVAN